MQRFANPHIFLTLQKRLQPWLAAATAGAFAVGLYLALLVAPPDYQQGESVRIMFVHVPAASLGLAIYVLMAAASAVAIIFRHPLADVAARAAAPVGACFTFIALATGAIWGKPMWGAWWVWEARLTSSFVLFLLYLGYIAIWQTFRDPHQAARIARIVALVGVVNVPIVKFSVEWWATLHQPSSLFARQGPAIHASMLTPLLVMMAAYGLLFVCLQFLGMSNELQARKIHHLQLARLGGLQDGQDEE